MKSNYICLIARLITEYHLKHTIKGSSVSEVTHIDDKHKELDGYLAKVLVTTPMKKDKIFYVFIHKDITRIDVHEDNQMIFGEVMRGLEPLQRYSFSPKSGTITKRKMDVSIHEWDMNSGRGKFIIIRNSDGHALMNWNPKEKKGYWYHLGVGTQWRAEEQAFSTVKDAITAAKSYGFVVVGKVIPYQRGRLFW